MFIFESYTEPYGILFGECYCDSLDDNILKFLFKSYTLNDDCKTCKENMEGCENQDRSGYLCEECKISNIVVHDDLEYDLDLSITHDMYNIKDAKYKWIKNKKVVIYNNHHFLIQFQSLTIDEMLNFSTWLTQLQNDDRMPKNAVYRKHYLNSCVACICEE